MNLVLHHFRKDLRSQRILLGLWLLLVLLQFGIAFWAPRADDIVMHGLYSVAVFAVPLLGSLLLLVLVPLLVLQEPLVGTSAFWLTRPLSGRQLLAAKGLFVAVLAGLPLLAQSVLLAANGATLREVGLGALQLAVSQLSWIAILFALAVFASSFGRFAIIAAVYGLVAVAFGLGVYWYGLFHDPDYAADAMRKLSLSLSRNLVDAFLTVAFGTAVAAHQYLTRNTRRSLFLVLAAWAAVAVGGHLWPWDFLKPAPFAGTAFDAAPLRLSLIGRVSAFDQASLRGGAARKAVNGTFLTEGLPAGTVVRIRNIDSSLARPGGGTVKIVRTSINAFGESDAEALEKALGAVILNGERDHFDTQNLFAVEAAEYAKDGAAPLDFSARIEVEAAHWVAQPDIPLQKGARWSRGSERLVVASVLQQPDGVDILAEERKVNLLYDRSRPPEASIPGLDAQRVCYVLLNRKYGEAFVQRRLQPSLDMLAGTSILSNHPLRLSFGPEQRNHLTLPITPEWLADAVLVRLELVTLADVTKTLTIPGFRMDGQFVLPGLPRNSEKADPAALAAIVLPDNPDDTQMHGYALAIFVASRHQMGWSDRDPQVALIEKIGPGHVGILLDLLRSVGSGPDIYLFKAIEDLAGPDDKEAILAALPANKGLIRIVNKMGWQADAHDLIVATVEKPPREGLDGGWFTAAGALRDPAIYPALRSRFVQGPNRKTVYQAVRDLPDFDLGGSVSEAWRKARTGSDWEVREMLPIAAEAGLPDALDAAAHDLRNPADGSRKTVARQVFRDFTAAPDGSDADLAAWYDANKAGLKFDPATKKFALPAPAQ